MKILVADDEPMVLRIVTRLLELLEHEVVQATDGSQALANLQDQEDFDLVILDQNMPGLKGMEVLAKLRASHPTLPVLISSGDRALDIDDPHAGQLKKPYRLEVLEAALDSVSNGQL